MENNKKICIIKKKINFQKISHLINKYLNEFYI